MCSSHARLWRALRLALLILVVLMKKSVLFLLLICFNSDMFNNIGVKDRMQTM